MPVQDTTENAEGCLCPTCPTHDECMKDRDELLFCARGGTGCDPASSGCICGDCPVWAQEGLTGYYFCLNGAAE